MQKFGKFCPEDATHGTFGVEISPSKSQGYHFQKNWSSQRYHFDTVGGTPVPEI